LAESIPIGYTSTPAGVIVKREFAASTTQDSQFDFLSTGRDNPEKRGQDRGAQRKYPTMLAEIQTSRHRDPLVFRAVDFFDKLALGSGLTLASEESGVLDNALAHWESWGMDDLQHQISIELVEAGNVFAWLPEPRGGKNTLELIPTGQVDRIATKDGAVWYYRRKWEAIEYEDPKTEPQKSRRTLMAKPTIMTQDIMAEEMVHVAVNRGVGELRGMSPLEPAIYWSSLYGRTLETIWAMSVARSLLAIQIKARAESTTKLTEIRDDIETNLLISKTDPRGMEYKTLPTGQVVVTDDQTEINVLGGGITAGSNDAELRRMLLMFAVAVGLPEFALSDGNYANLASSLSQSNPFFRLMLAHQQVVITVVRRIFRKLFDRLALEGGPLATFKPDPSKGKRHIVDYLTITAPDILSADATSLATALAPLVNNRIISRQRANEMLGNDWEKMAEQMAAEKAEGFVSIQPNANPAQTPLPFSAAADVKHEETQKLMKGLRGKMRGELDAFQRALLNSDGDTTMMIKAYNAFFKQASAEMKDLIIKAREVGQESIYAGD
jgi:hypothetical protein